MSSKKGFTLIELLVVIAIIGILSSVELASLNSARQKSRDARRVSDIKQVQLALELYYDSCSSYPQTLATTASNGCPSGTTLGSFIAKIPTDPSTNAAYSYGVYTSNVIPPVAGNACSGSSVCTFYQIGATLEGDSSALQGDTDADGNIVHGPDTHDCATGTGTGHCYDVTP